ncbi:MAG TPA: hypothetical protein VGI39_42505 [Polyangiaceae bacterium]|jgi:hypothetical protein
MDVERFSFAGPLLVAASLFAAPAVFAQDSSAPVEPAKPPQAPDSASTSPAVTAPPSGSSPSAPAPAAAPTAPDLTGANWVLTHKHTLAELEIGFIALPGAAISPGQTGGNIAFGNIGKISIGQGDATVDLGAHVLYRAAPAWALGAGALFAPRPSSDDEYRSSSGLKRTHSRSYLLLDGELRFIPLHWRTVEAWAGATVGGVVIADRFDTAAPPVPPDLGTSVVTVNTEGFFAGLQMGGEWAFAERLILGFALRWNEWVLPNNYSCTPIGDCTTLIGTATELEFGLRLGYRIPL